MKSLKIKKKTRKLHKRLLWIPTAAAFADSIAIFFLIIQKTPFQSMSDSLVCPKNVQAS